MNTKLDRYRGHRTHITGGIITLMIAIRVTILPDTLFLEALSGMPYLLMAFGVLLGTSKAAEKFKLKEE